MNGKIFSNTLQKWSSCLMVGPEFLHQSGYLLLGATKQRKRGAVCLQVYSEVIWGEVQDAHVIEFFFFPEPLKDSSWFMCSQTRSWHFLAGDVTLFKIMSSSKPCRMGLKRWVSYCTVYSYRSVPADMSAWVRSVRTALSAWICA